MSIIPYAGVFRAIVIGLPIGIAATVVLLTRFRARVARSMRETVGKKSAQLLTTGASAETSAPMLFCEAQVKPALVVNSLGQRRCLLVTQRRRVRLLQQGGRRDASPLFMRWRRVS
jgi:hypothetical protein